MLEDKHIAHTLAHLYPAVMSIWCGLDRVVWHKRHSMVTLLGHGVWNPVISHSLNNILSWLCCMSTVPDLCATMPISTECRVTKFISNIFPLSKYSRMLFESRRFLCCWAAVQSLCWSLFNCWTSSLISVHTGFNRSQVTCCTLVIHQKPGGTHIYFVRLSPPPAS